MQQLIALGTKIYRQSKKKKKFSHLNKRKITLMLGMTCWVNPFSLKSHLPSINHLSQSTSPCHKGTGIGRWGKQGCFLSLQATSKAISMISKSQHLPSFAVIGKILMVLFISSANGFYSYLPHFSWTFNHLKRLSCM